MFLIEFGEVLEIPTKSQGKCRYCKYTIPISSMTGMVY